MKKNLKKSIIMTMLLMVSILGVTSCNRNNPSGSFDSSKKITVVTRTDGSGTKSAFMEIIGLKGKKDTSGAITVDSTNAILATVKTNPLALAYESLGYITDEVKVVKIDNIACTVDNIKSNDYKIARPLNIIYKQETLNNSLYLDFYNYVGSAESQKLIADNGYVSTTENASEYAKSEDLSGTINISGSTSLRPLMILIAEKYEEIQKNVTVVVSGGGSGTGYKNAEEGVSDFGMISEQFDSSKASSCTYYEVAKDGIALIVNKANPVKNISLSSLKNIYDADVEASEKITTWSQVQ